MALINKAKKSSGTRKFSLAQMPSKTTINLVTVGQKRINLKLAIPALILILALIVVLGKFLVFDRFAEVAQAQRVVDELQTRLSAGYEELAGYEDLNDLYAHYTYSGFTEEELGRTSRVEVLRLIRQVVLPKVELNSWSLTSNELIIDVTGKTLQDINMLALDLQDDSLVNYCTVSTANTNDQRSDRADGDAVTARVLVYLESMPGDAQE